MARFKDWNPYNRYVESGSKDGEYLNAEFTLIASGPARLADINQVRTQLDPNGVFNGIVFPLGVLQSFGLSHSRNFNRFWEIGSERSFFISGRTMGQASLGRIMYHGPSLLRGLYATYQDAGGDVSFPAIVPGIEAIFQTANPHDVKVPPGYENLFLNLASDLFSQPHGELIHMLNSNEVAYGSSYLEACYVPQHSMNVDSSGTVLSENAAVQFERLVPVAVSAIPLIQIDDFDADSTLLG